MSNTKLSPLPSGFLQGLVLSSLLLGGCQFMPVQKLVPEQAVEVTPGIPPESVETHEFKLADGQTPNGRTGRYQNA